jgi:hypothetical protein
LAGAPRALATLAEQYWKGFGVTKDYAAGVALLEFGIEQGFANAKLERADLLLSESGSPASTERAIRLLEEAAPEYHKAYVRLGAIFRTSDSVRALGYFQKAVDSGDSHGLIDLGRLYAGDPAGHVAYDGAKALEFLIRSHNLRIGKAEALALTGTIVEREWRAKRRMPRGEDWLWEQSRDGSSQAMAILQSLVIDARLVASRATPDAPCTLRLWNSEPRPLDEALVLRLGGERIVEVAVSDSWERVFTANADLEHVWRVGTGLVATANAPSAARFDCMEGSAVQITRPPGKTRISQRVPITSEGPAYSVFVGEDSEGRLSNAVVLRVVEE